MEKYIPTVVTEALRIVVCTRNRNFDNDEYQKGVVEPYNKIQEMQDQLEKNNAQPDHEQMLAALQMLGTVFTTKKVPVDEQLERFEEIFEKTKLSPKDFPEFKLPEKN